MSQAIINFQDRYVVAHTSSGSTTSPSCNKSIGREDGRRKYSKMSQARTD